MTGRRTVVATIVAAVAAAGAGVLAYRRQDPAPGDDGLAPSRMFYRQSLRDADGTMHTMSDHRGKPVLVNFWATWCVPCVKEIPAFSRVHAETGGGIAFVGLGIDSPDSIAAFTKRFTPSYPLLAAGAEGTELARALGDESGALPFTVLIGPDGRIVESHLGQLEETALRRWIAPFAARNGSG